MQTHIIRKPRFNGQVLTEAEIMAKSSRDLDALVAVCFFGFQWIFTIGCPKEREGSYLINRVGEGSGFGSRYKQVWSIEEPQKERHPEWAMGVPHYSTDIAESFLVHLPHWRWTTHTYGSACEAMIWFMGENNRVGNVPAARVRVELKTPPQLADQARSRCLAAMVLAARIGE